MSDKYIRICPVCERENAAQTSRCTCGTSLMGVDFSVKAPLLPPAQQAVVDPAPPSPSRLTTKKDRLSLPSPLADDLGKTVCPHADCAQPNPQGIERCLYCNRPLAGGPASYPTEAAELQMRVPAVLRQRFTAIELLPTQGAQADLFRVRRQSDSSERVIKLYRQGNPGDIELLNQLLQVRDPHVIRIDETGVAGGVRFEVMEYFPCGSLRQLLGAGPVSVARIHEMVSEIGQALAQLQAIKILHRDLKPENVLVRTLSPLSLVLTDFGIASLRMGTQHFTNGARTTRYAAPEALTGVIDERADWWSLGMIILEAVLGRHPFEGLNEQIINYQLATQPVDVRPVFHDDLRKLCRGLLMRDPTVRWSWPEVQRWLAGDPTLTEPQEGAVNASLRPYRIADSQCTTALELALTLVKHWELGAQDLARGTVARWLEEQLHEHNLLRQWQDIMDRRGVSNDWRLLKFVLLIVPDIPAVWKGLPVSRESLLIAARQAYSQDRSSATWLDSLHTEGVLEVLAEGQRPEVAAFRQLWLQGLERCETLWKLAQDAEDRWRREPKAWYGSNQVVVDVDYALYLQSSRMGQPAVDRLHGPVLLAVNMPVFVNMVRTEIINAVASGGDVCPWLKVLGPLHQLEGVGVIVAQLLLPLAQEDMALEAERLVCAQNQGKANTAQAYSLLRQQVQTVLDIVSKGLHNQNTRKPLRQALQDLHSTGVRFIRLAPTEKNAAKARAFLDSLISASLILQAQLDKVEAIHRINAIWLAPRRLFLGGVLLLGLWPLVSGRWVFALLVVAVAGAAWRYLLWKVAVQWLGAKARTLARLCEKTVGPIENGS